MDSFALQIAAKGIRAETAPLPAVWGQQAKLTCLVENLIANAIKYVPSGGGRIRVAGEMVAGSIRFRVEDNGIGIPEEYHRRIFELFGRVPPDLQRVDGRSVTGSGVGLAVIRRIVELHGGSISVASTIGRGSTFEVRLPDAATAQGRDV